MAITLIQVDKSGSDIFEKDYSIVIVVNKKYVYGINIPQQIKDKLMSSFKKGDLNINDSSEKKRKNRFRLRFHTAVVIKLIEKAIFDQGHIEEVSFEICNDFDGHFHEIKNMVFANLSKIIPTLAPEDILSTKFQKPSLIDDAGKAFRNRDKEKLNDYESVSLNYAEIYRMIRK